MHVFAAAAFSWFSLESWWHIAQMAIGLGVVIFVHELGHFLVAKACGVKCEKFYIGFDVPLGRFFNWLIGREGEMKLFGMPFPRTVGWPVKWGETEYGIGILPLGGYVKMLGQDDNPNNQQAENERSKIRKTGEDVPAADGTQGIHHESVTDLSLEPTPLAGKQEEFELDPRSYKAKNVPQRMAIISAGVIMNVIFAVVFATLAYSPWVGVNYIPTIIGGTSPGSPAWENELPVGAQILQVNRSGVPDEHMRFRQDFSQRVMMHGGDSDLELLVREHGSEKPRWIDIRPAMIEVGMGIGKLPMVGISSMSSLKIGDLDLTSPGTPAFAVKDKLKKGDEIFTGSVGGKETKFETYPDLQAFLAQHPDESVTLHLKRKIAKDGQPEQTETFTVELRPQPVRSLGIIPVMGPVTAIQVGSPAKDAGIRKGDVLEAIDGTKIANPLLVPELLRRRANQSTEVTVLRADRDGNRTPMKLTVTPRPAQDYQAMLGGIEPILVDALGLTYMVQAKVADSTGPAKGKVEAGDILKSFSIMPAGQTPQEIAKNTQMLKDLNVSDKEIELKDERVLPPVLFNFAQWAPTGSKVKVNFLRGKDLKSVELVPADDAEFQFPDRGLRLAPVERIHIAKTWPEAFRLGLRDTGEQLTMVFAFLKKLATGKIRFTAMGGLPSIFVAGTREASQGPGTLLLFLTMLSANLAVVNFLPIPMLDGGHMMFLLYEGIMRRPVNEAWELRLTLLGLSFLLCLMVFVFGLDIYRLSGLAN